MPTRHSGCIMPCNMALRHIGCISLILRCYFHPHTPDRKAPLLPYVCRLCSRSVCTSLPPSWHPHSSSCRPWGALPALPESAQVRPTPPAGRTKKRRLAESYLKGCGCSSKSPSGLQELQSCFQRHSKKPQGAAGGSSPRSCRLAGTNIRAGLEGELWS